MPLTNAGRDLIATSIAGESYTPYDNANAHIGVGNGTTAFSVTQTDLQGASTSRDAMEAGYPDRTTNVITYRSLFNTSQANFRWEEWGLFNAASGGEMLNRVVEFLGEKTSAQSWQFTVDITIEIGS